MLSILLATVLTLHPGLNSAPNAAGKVAAAEAVTVQASATVALKSVRSVTQMTNAYELVTTPHTVYTFTITNFNGSAAVTTNVWDVFDYSDWYAGTTNLIISPVVPTPTNLTESVLFAKLPGATYTVTNSLLSISASSHTGSASPGSTTWFFGGDILVTGAGDDDLVTLIIDND